MSIFIGIDPGKSGGISAIQENGLTKKPRANFDSNGKRFSSDPYHYVYPMPDTEQFIMQIFVNIFRHRIGIWSSTASSEDEPVKAIIEAQHAFPGMSAKGQWSFAQHYGFIRGCLVSLGIPFVEVSPQKWMSYFGFKRLKDEDKKKHKLRILQKAQNLFPQSSVALQTADSLMLAEYLRLTDRS